MNTVRGFTLIELMIVMAIVGILAAVAYPSYNAHIVRTHRGAAQACLLEYAQLAERTYTTNLSYAGINPLPVLACVGEVNRNANPARYTFTAPVATGTTFTVRATAGGVQATRDANCVQLDVTQQGARISRDANNALTTNCW